jgi:hypothetical protein
MAAKLPVEQQTAPAAAAAAAAWLSRWSQCGRVRQQLLLSQLTPCQNLHAAEHLLLLLQSMSHLCLHHLVVPPVLAADEQAVPARLLLLLLLLLRALECCLRTLPMLGCWHHCLAKIVQLGCHGRLCSSAASTLPGSTASCAASCIEGSGEERILCMLGDWPARCTVVLG